MTITELQHRLLSDLRAIHLPVDDVEVYFRPFSKTYYGRYFPVKNERNTKAKIYVYPFASQKRTLLPYDVILDTAIHEFCHHIQYAQGYKRVQGIMHNTEFWQLYNLYKNRAEKRGLVS